MKLRQFMEGQRKNRKSLSQTNRMKLWKQAHGRCWYCGGDTPKTFFVLEHVEPFSRGGADSKRNLVVSCWQCDREKGAMNLEEFRAHRNHVEFYGEKERKARLAKRIVAREEKRPPKPPAVRLVRLSEKMPATVAALMIAERGKYVREPYRF